MTYCIKVKMCQSCYLLPTSISKSIVCFLTAWLLSWLLSHFSSVKFSLFTQVHEIERTTWKHVLFLWVCLTQHPQFYVLFIFMRNLSVFFLVNDILLDMLLCTMHGHYVVESKYSVSLSCRKYVVRLWPSGYVGGKQEVVISWGKWPCPGHLSSLCSQWYHHLLHTAGRHLLPLCHWWDISDTPTHTISEYTCVVVFNFQYGWNCRA